MKDIQKQNEVFSRKWCQELTEFLRCEDRNQIAVKSFTQHDYCIQFHAWQAYKLGSQDCLIINEAHDNSICWNHVSFWISTKGKSNLPRREYAEHPGDERDGNSCWKAVSAPHTQVINTGQCWSYPYHWRDESKREEIRRHHSPLRICCTKYDERENSLLKNIHNCDVSRKKLHRNDVDNISKRKNFQNIPHVSFNRSRPQRVIVSHRDPEQFLPL